MVQTHSENRPRTYDCHCVCASGHDKSTSAKLLGLMLKYKSLTLTTSPPEIQGEGGPEYIYRKEKSQELSIRPCKSVIFKVDLYMKMFGLCTISRLNTIVNEKMRLFNSTYIKAQRAQSSFHFRFDQKFLEIVTFERVLPMGARPRPSLFLL